MGIFVDGVMLYQRYQRFQRIYKDHLREKRPQTRGRKGSDFALSGRASQAKGRRGELELVELLQKAGYTSVKPGQAVSFGGTPDVVGLPGVHVECKRHERLELSAWLKQAARDAEAFGDGLPVCFHRANRQPWIVSMELDVFLQFLAAIKP